LEEQKEGLEEQALAAGVTEMQPAQETTVPTQDEQMAAKISMLHRLVAA
jgi:hypothetical protein